MASQFCEMGAPSLPSQPGREAFDREARTPLLRDQPDETPELARYRSLARAVGIVWTSSASGRVIDDIPEWRAYTGQSAREVLGSGWIRAVHPDDRDRAAAVWAEAVRRSTDYTVDYRVRGADGVYRWFNVRGCPVRNADGSVREWVGLCISVDERRRAEEALEQSQGRLRAALEGSATSTYVWDFRTNVVDSDDGLIRLFGLDPNSTSGAFEQFISLIHPEDRERVLAGALRCATEGADFDDEYRVIRPDGSLRWVVAKGKTVRAPDGKPLYLTGSVVDVTDIRVREEEVRVLAEAMPQMAWMALPTGERLWYNQRWYDYSGTTIDEMRGFGWRKLHHPEHLRRVMEHQSRAFAAGEVWEDTFPLRGKDGRFRWFLSRAMPVKAADGKVIRYLGTNTDITEQRLIEDQLRVSQERVRLALEAGRMGSWEWDIEERRVARSPQLEGMLGVSEGGLTGSIEAYEALVHPDDRARLREVLADGLSRRAEGYHFLHRIVRPDGSVRWIDSHGRFMYARNGRPLRLVGVSADVTERQIAAEALKQRELALQEAQRIAHLGSYVRDIGTGEEIWSEGLYRLYGVDATAHPPSGDLFLSLLHPDDRPRIEAQMHRPATVGPLPEEEFRIVRPDGIVRVFHSQGTIEGNAAGQPSRIVGVLQDVTERRAIEHWLRLLSEELPVIVWTALPDGSLDHVGARAEEFFGVSPQQLLGSGWQIIIHPDDLANTWERWKYCLATGDSFEIQYRFRRADGAFRWFLGLARPVHDSSGRIEKWFGTCTDIHDQKMAEEARDRALNEVKLERQRLHEVFMQAPAAIAVTEGPAHIFIVANPLFCQMVGDRELLGKRAREVFPDAHLEPIEDARDQAYATGVPYVGVEVYAPLDRDGDGKLEDAYFDFVFQPLMDADGKSFGMMIHAVDVTDKVRARVQVEAKADELARLTVALERSNRELDQFAYVASHDLKAPLRGIANLAQWIREDVGDALPTESREHLRVMHGRVRRMEALIDGILTYSRAARTRGRPEPVDTGTLVRDLVELLAPPANVTVEIAPRLPTVVAERVPLQQVFMNLVSNAVRHGRTEAPRVEISWREAGDAYEFSVRDNGQGIAPEFHQRIWGIFQTLEARDKVEGTGIGLAVVKKVVESRGGTVSVESAAGAGATFRFTWLKVAPDAIGAGDR